MNGYLRGHALNERSRTPSERHLNALRPRTENPLRVEISTEGVEYVHFSCIIYIYMQMT